MVIHSHKQNKGEDTRHILKLPDVRNPHSDLVSFSGHCRENLCPPEGQ